MLFVCFFVNPPLWQAYSNKDCLNKCTKDFYHINQMYLIREKWKASSFWITVHWIALSIWFWLSILNTNDKIFTYWRQQQEFSNNKVFFGDFIKWSVLISNSDFRIYFAEKCYLKTWQSIILTCFSNMLFSADNLDENLNLKFSSLFGDRIDCTITFCFHIMWKG